MRDAPHGAQVPLLTVMESVAPVRVPGRLPLFQVWFDIQPVSFEGTEKLEDLSIEPLAQARQSHRRDSPPAVALALTCYEPIPLTGLPWLAVKHPPVLHSRHAIAAR